MSFDIFVFFYKNGDISPIPRSQFEEIFGREAVDPAFPLTDVQYPDGSRGDIYGAEDDLIESLMFNHCGGPTFNARLFELLDRLGGTLQWPGEAPCYAVTRREVLDHLPPCYSEEWGPPCVGSSFDEIEEAIRIS